MRVTKFKPAHVASGPAATLDRAPLMAFEIIIILLGAFTGGFISGLSGFGMGLGGMAFWVFALPPVVAAPLAAAAGVELVFHEPSFKHIANLFSRRGREMPERNRVQALFPEGSTPIKNPEGTAPGIHMAISRNGGGQPSRLVAMPGVPSEMKAIFNESGASLLKQVARDVTFFEMGIESTGLIESEMAPIVERVMNDNPYVYLKSHPKGAEKITRVEFHFSTTAKNPGIARKRVSKALVQLSELIQEKGGKIKPTKPEN